MKNLYERLVRPLLFLVEPEAAHHFTIASLRRAGHFDRALRALKKFAPPSKPEALFGLNFPMLIVLFNRNAEASGSAVLVGRAYAANTLGAIAGSVITGFWLLPWLGGFRVIVVAAAVSTATGVVAHAATCAAEAQCLAVAAGHRSSARLHGNRRRDSDLRHCAGHQR